MGISMWVRSEMAERGDRLAEGEVAWAPPFDLLNLGDTPLLYGVDPYGDTVFNGGQCDRQLPSEIAYLRTRLLDPSHLAMLDELERLIAMTTRRVHTYLWFIGD